MSDWATIAQATTEAELGGIWVDISRWVLTPGADGGRGSVVEIPTGRQTELATTAEPGRITSLTLENRVLPGSFTTLTDAFGRTVSGGLGTADSGQAYSTLGGAGSDYSVGSGVAVLSLGSVDVYRRALVALNAPDVDITGTVVLSVAPTGAPADLEVIARWVDTSNFVDARLFATTGGSVTCAVRQLVGGTETATSFPTVAGVTSTSTIAWRLQAIGPFLRFRAWLSGTAEPSSWAVSMTTTWMTSGSVGFGATLEAGNTNTLPVTASWDNLSAVDPHAAAGRFTVGNIVSPWYPYWRQGQRIRIREQVGDRVFDTALMYLEIPETAIDTEGLEQQVNVTAVDRIGRLDNGRTFVSTLAEYVLYNGTGLQAYYPMGETSDITCRNVAPVTRENLTVRNIVIPSGTLPGGTDLLSMGGGTGPPGDDLSLVHQSVVTSAGAVTRMNFLQADWAGVSQSSGQTITVAWWMDWEDVTTDNVFLAQISGSGASLALFRSGATQWQISGLSATAVLTINVTGPSTGAPQLMAIRLTLPSGLMEFWRHTDTAVTGTLGSGTPASSATWTKLIMGDRYQGSLGHAQVYVGDSTVYTQAQHLAQINMGYTGLERQRVDERIRTVAKYAGLTDADLSLDVASTPMQRASLAGQKPGSLIRSAAETERGRLFVDGTGRINLHSRRHTYNI